MRAKHLLKARAVWAIPVIVGSILIVLITVFYIGSVVDPEGHLRGLPVSIVNEDAGASVGPQHVDLGQQVQAALTNSRTLSTLLALKRQGLASAEGRMNRDDAYATLVIPPDFTASLLSLTGLRLPPGTSAGKPTVELLTNQRAGSVGVELASGVLQPAIAQVSQRIGHKLLASAHPTPSTGSALAALLADPIALSSVDFRPLPAHSALGLSAFYVALLTLMCGFLGAMIINTAVDVASGYAATDIGPRWRQRPPLPINRWQTLLTKWIMALPLTALLTGLVLVVATEILGMDAPGAGYLWLFSWLAALSVAIGTLVLLAALGSQGQLLAMLLFVYLGLASAGGTVPLQALPGVLKLVSDIEPLRQILAGDRAILYFGAAGDAGLDRGLILASAGLAFWLALGTTVVRWYDRKGLHRIRPEDLAYVHQTISTFHAADPQPGAPDAPAGPQAPDPEHL